MSRVTKSKKAYAQAGVDVDLGNEVKSVIQKIVSDTHGPQVLSGIGGFGGLFEAKFTGMREPVLVSSIDGVGTKLKLAFEMQSHTSVGQDLVNHCVNDIAVTGARPLFFLDYLGAGRLEPNVFTQLLKGFAKACKAAGCALIGGETAQMPGFYSDGEYDVAGCIVGVVDRKEIWDGSKIKAGDVLLGLPSSGLHTNGYSLARKVLQQKMKLPLDEPAPGMRLPLGKELLKIHRSYLAELTGPARRRILGAAHITGGGLIDNLPRVLPDDCDAVIDVRSWKIPPIYRLIQTGGKVDPAEMFQVFNMGIGMVLVVRPKDAAELATALKARTIGTIQKGQGVVMLEGLTVE